MAALASNYNAILAAVKTLIDGLKLLDWGPTGSPNPLPSAVRKLPTVDETIDALPLICIVPKAQEPKRVAYTFGPTFKVTYPIEIVVVAPGNRDFVTHLDFYMGWEAAIAAAFNLPTSLKALVSAVWDLNVRPGVPIDRERVNDDYDYGGLTIEVIAEET